MLYKVGRPAVSTDKPLEPVELSIGTLASATGVPVDTLRTWERRYGFPAPVTRTGGSHRRYAPEAIGQVRLIVRALELGHRPSAVVGRDPEELRRLLGVAALEPALGPEESSASDRRAIARWLEHTRRLEGDALSDDFRRALAEMSALEFLSRRMGPYLAALGEAWANGALRVSHEHFASERAREFLNAQWRGLGPAARAARSVVLATPPGEEHALGLHMAAWVIALAGVRVVFLGVSTPMAEVAFAVERFGASGAVLSVAAGYAGDLPGHLDELGRLLPAGVAVAVGGTGSCGLVRSERILNNFFDLFDWSSALLAAPVRDV